MMSPRKSRLRLPTKLEIGGIALVGLAVWFGQNERTHPEGDPWWHYAGIGSVVLTGVVMFVGQPAIDTMKSLVGIAGYAKRELRRRSTSTTRVPASDDDSTKKDA
jgi:hypothetical protein